MRRPLDDDGTIDGAFENILRQAEHSLFRFEQQPQVVFDRESRLLADFRRGIHTPPTAEPEMRAWYDQVRGQTRRGIAVERVRIVDTPATKYQQWLQYIDGWNRAAGEDIHYLPRRSYDQYRTGTRPALRPPFAGAEAADWWLVDNRIALISPYDEHGVRGRVEVCDGGPELAAAATFRHHVRALALQIEKEARRRAA